MATAEKEIQQAVGECPGPLESVEVPGLVGEAIPAEELRPADPELIILDEETMTLVNSDTGEVIGVADTPAEDAPAVEIAKWVGEQRDWHRGRLAGLQAEKAIHLEKLEKVYDARINRHVKAIAWMEKQYTPMLFELAKKLIGEGKKRSVAVGMLILKLRKTRPTLDVQDNDKAVRHFQALIAEQERRLNGLHKAMNQAAEEGDDDMVDGLKDKIDCESLYLGALTSCLNIKTTVYKSAIPDTLKTDLTTDNAKDTGMLFDKGGAEKLEIE